MIHITGIYVEMYQNVNILRVTQYFYAVSV